MELTPEIKEVLRDNISHFATASRDGKPNVVPVGVAEPISDNQVLLVDVLFNKTRKNLEDNPQVALAVTDLNNLQAYQIKGKAEIITSGELFEKGLGIMQEKSAKRDQHMVEKINKLQDSELKKRYEQITAWQKNLKPKAVVLINVTEIYPTM